MLVSEAGARPVSADANLISPPRGWPETFKSNAMLKTFLNKTLQGRKARLVAPATAEVAVEATLSPPLESADCASVAARVYAELSWPVLEGVAVYELDEAPDTFVAFRYKWNLHPRNIWVDLAARPPKHPQLLLVECEVNAAFGRGNEVLSSASPPPQAAQQPLPEATPPSLPPPPPSSEPTGASPPVATAPPAPARTYEQILASLPLGPKALEKQLIMEGALPKRGKPKRDPHKVIGVFKAQPDAKRRWPPMAAEVRLRLRADRSVELEARCWRKGTEEEELQRMLCASEWFAPLEYGDPEAAQLRVRGKLIEQSQSCWLKIDHVEELRNGDRKPPLTQHEVRAKCGASLLTGMEAHWCGDTQLNVGWWGRDKGIIFHKEDNGWASD